MIALPVGEPIAVGLPAPDFEIDLSDGTRFSLSGSRGRPVVLAFFPAEWDPSRNHRLEIYNEALSRVPGEFRLLSISSDSYWFEAEVEGEGQVRFPLLQGISSDGEIADLYRVRGCQAVFVVDQEGAVCWRHVGTAGSHASIDSLVAVLRSMTPRQGLSRSQFVVTAVATLVALSLIPGTARAQGQAVVGSAPVADHAATSSGVPDRSSPSFAEIL
jgi:peroxiredoxin